MIPTDYEWFEYRDEIIDSYFYEDEAEVEDEAEFDEDWGFNEDEGFDPYEGCWTGDC